MHRGDRGLGHGVRLPCTRSHAFLFFFCFFSVIGLIIMRVCCVSADRGRAGGGYVTPSSGALSSGSVRALAGGTEGDIIKGAEGGGVLR